MKTLVNILRQACDICLRADGTEKKSWHLCRSVCFVEQTVRTEPHLVFIVKKAGDEEDYVHW